MVAYLLASLPTPRLGAEPGIEREAFLERCAGFVGDDRARDLAWVLGVGDAGPPAAPTAPRDAGQRPSETTHPSRRPADALADPASRAWATLAELVDEAVMRVRAARSRRDPTPDLPRPHGYRVDVAESVADAFERPDPGARERALDELRWRLTDELTIAEPDGFGALLARAVQLRLAWRRVGWDTQDGWERLEAAMRQLEEDHG